MIGIAIGSFLLLLVVAYLIGRPFFAPRAMGESGESQLSEDQDRLLSQISDLDMEFATGKLSSDEYRALRSGRLAEAEATAEALADALGSQVAEVGPAEMSEPSPVAGNSRIGADDPLEREIAARKRALESQGCPDCGAVVDPDDRFCRRCGGQLTKVETG